MCLITRRKKWKYCVCLIVLLGGLRVVVTFLSWKDVNDITELEKCPACFGISFCSVIMTGSVKFTHFYSITTLINFIGYKNVWFGMYENKIVVIKKLGSYWELQELDKKLCDMQGDKCHISDVVANVTNFSVIEKFIENAMNLDTSATGTGPDNFYVCPSTGRLSKLLKAVRLRNKDVSLKTFLQNVWTIVHINPEPLILQILSKEDGWPVPAYYGSCGRIIVEEYIGDTLTSYYSKPWIERAKLAYKLLVAAKKFTNDHPEFRFYLTDVSPDNIAVDTAGSVYFIDLENIIIVDRNISNDEKTSSWMSPHVSEIYECESCFIFSVNEICTHYISDHNLYAVCQHLLSSKAVPGIMPGGFLHSIPNAVLEHYPNFTSVLTQCGESSAPFGRFHAAEQLLELLANITQTYRLLK